MYMQWINKSIFEQKTSGFLTAEIAVPQRWILEKQPAKKDAQPWAAD